VLLYHLEVHILLSRNIEVRIMSQVPASTPQMAQPSHNGLVELATILRIQAILRSIPRGDIESLSSDDLNFVLKFLLDK